MGQHADASSAGDQDAAVGSQLARELRELRERVPLSLRDLERRTHVSDSSLSRYLAGQALPPWKVVEVLGRLGRGDLAELRTLWELARIERRRSRSARPARAPDEPAAPADPPEQGEPADLDELQDPDKPPVLVEPAVPVGIPPSAPPAAPPAAPPPVAVLAPLPRFGWHRHRHLLMVIAVVVGVVVAAVLPTVVAGRLSGPDDPLPGEESGPVNDVRVSITNSGPHSSVRDIRGIGVAGWAMPNGAPVRLWSWDTRIGQESRNLVWTARELGPNAEGLRRYRFANLNSERCLDRGGERNGAEVFQWDCNDSASQIWFFDGSGLLRSALDRRCLDIKDAQWRDGAVLQMWDCRATWNRRWYMSFQPPPTQPPLTQPPLTEPLWTP